MRAGSVSSQEHGGLVAAFSPRATSNEGMTEMKGQDQMSNLPTIEDINRDPGLLISLPLEVLDLLLIQADELTRRAAFAKKAIQNTLGIRYAKAEAQLYTMADKDTGTVRMMDGDYEIIFDRSKKVEWDQTALAMIWQTIAATENPAEYIDVSYAVAERKFSAWPTYLTELFAPARTLKPGPTSIKLARKAVA